MYFFRLSPSLAGSYAKKSTDHDLPLCNFGKVNVTISLRERSCISEINIFLTLLLDGTNVISLNLCTELCPGSKPESVRNPLLKGVSDTCSCGGRTRTCDLQVMSLASYQLLHSAMLIFNSLAPHF